MFNPNEKGIPITRNPIPPPALSGSGSKGIISAPNGAPPFILGAKLVVFCKRCHWVFFFLWSN